MDSRRFDAIVRSAATPATRRSALGALVAGGVVGAFGFGRAEAARVASQGQGGLCVLIFVATVRQGPSASRPLVAGGAPGELRGTGRFSLSGSGNLQNADLLLDDGSSLPVVGQATGHGIQVRIDFGQGRALVAVGVGEQDVTRCLGPLDGPATGPEVGDLGEWHAAAGVQNLASGSAEDSGGAQPGGRGNRPAGGSAGSGNRQSGGSTGGGSQPSGGGSTGRGNDRGSTSGGNELRSTGEGSTGGGSGPACPSGRTRCGDACVDLQTDPLHCGQCGLPCASELGASACIDGACACSPGTTRCDDVCVNTDRDPLNCGGCGAVCSDDEECVGGACGGSTGGGSTGGGSAQACPEGQTRCGDAGCRVLDLDLDHCGECFNACADGEECVGGDCGSGETECAAGLTRCPIQGCVDTERDPFFCGSCDNACNVGEGETCVGGACTPGATAGQTAGCPEGQVLCGDECRNALTSADGGVYCSGGGAPPTACPPGLTLCNGACYAEGACQPADCPTGQGRCYGVCKDFSSDPGYCGNCTTACPGAICSGGVCVTCADGLTPCGAACVDTATDLGNCGFCGNACGTQCLNGQCTAVGPSPLEVGYTCPTGQTFCGDACVYTAEDDANCGQCGNVCNEANVCSGGRCVNSDAACKSIDTNLSACVTRCADTRTDPEHCGGCFSSCGPGSECQGGLCSRPETTANTATLAGEAPPAFSCPEGQADCGGVCADLSFDPFNCGGCGVACGLDAPCDFGVCGAAPAPPPAPENLETTCVATGGACDPASPDACCSGVCNGDGACA